MPIPTRARTSALGGYVTGHGVGAGSGSGGGLGEAIRNIYYSDRQLPPGHDPGADSGEAPTAGSVAHGH
jgi:hypothetical protein